MKSERIVKALGNVDDRLVTETVPCAPIKKKRTWITLISAAAVVALCVFGTLELGVLSFQKPKISDPVLEEIDWDYVEDKLLNAPDSDTIGNEIRLEFLQYFRENVDHTFLTLLQWDWRFEMDDDYQSMMLPTLRCTGVTDLGYQTDSWVYLQGSVHFSGRTVEPFTGSADELRRYLTSYDCTSIESFRILNEMFVRYSMVNNTDFMHLPVFDEKNEPDWDDLMIYISMMDTTTVGTFDFDHLKKIVHTYLPNVEVRDEETDFLWKSEDGYQFMGYALGEGQTFYRLESLNETSAGLFEARLYGIELSYYDMFEGTDTHSYNWKNLIARHGEIVNLQNYKEYVLKDLLGSVDQYGYDLEVLTISFRLKDGDHPFCYYSCHRWPLAMPDEMMDAALDPQNVGTEAKSAFIQYLKNHPDRIWNCNPDAYNGLLYQGTHLKQEGVYFIYNTDKADGSLMLFYDTLSDEVEEIDDNRFLKVTDAVRFLLQDRAIEDDTQYMLELRKAFAEYYLSNPNELLYLPAFSRKDNPDWDSLSNFALQITGQSTLSKAEMNRAVLTYIENAKIFDSATSYVQYVDGVYSAYGTASEQVRVVYRLDQLQQVEEGIWMAEYLALEIGSFDTATGDTIRITENMMQLRRNYQAKRVEEIDHKAMMQALTTSESFENQGLRTSERIVVTFELQDGEHPFRYLSCERIPQ